MGSMGKGGLGYSKQMSKRRKPVQSYLDKIDFKPKIAIRDKNGHYIMIKGTINEGDITVINICTIYMVTDGNQTFGDEHTIVYTHIK